VKIRPATLADVDAIVAVLHANDEKHLDDAYVGHLLATGRVVVALIDEQLIGIGATIERGGVTHIADLYVDPSRQGAGVGGKLLTALDAARTPCTTFSSSDPRALPLYMRTGLVPWWPLLYFEGRPSRPLAAAFVVEPGNADDVAAIDAMVFAGRGAPDHAYYANRPGVLSFVVRDGKRSVAAGHTRNGIIEMLSIVDGADAVNAVSSVISFLADSRPGLIITALPGPHPAVRVLLDAGLRINAHDLYCATAPGLVDPVRRLPNPGLC
jgi:GNAT superfamily N-acetyltransferase